MAVRAIGGSECIGDAGRRAEKRAAGRVGGRQNRGSGSGRVKGDYHARGFKVEAKSTVRGSLQLKLEWMEKITAEAHGAGLEPAVHVLFARGDGRPRQAGAWIAVPEEVFKELTGG